MTVLVTGVAGFIGAHVAAALLARGDAVLGIDNLNAYYNPALKRARLDQLIGPHAGFRFVHCDFADAAALAAAVSGSDISAIVHLGAQAGVRHSITSPRDYVHSNLAGHLELLELARQVQPHHMVYASSSSVYGNAARLPLALDDRADQPVSLYAASKRANELMSESYAHLYQLPLTGLRFFSVYGPWGRPDLAIWRFTAAVLAGQPVPLFGGGTPRRDFTFISDIVAGVLAALDRPPAAAAGSSPHALFNLGHDEPASVADLLALIGAACGREPVVELLPMQPGDADATWADISAARDLLGYAPQVGLADGVARFVDWFRWWQGR